MKSKVIQKFSAATLAAFHGASAGDIRADTKTAQATDDGIPRYSIIAEAADTPDVIAAVARDFDGNETKSFKISFPKFDDWADDQEDRFKELVIKEALDNATDAEIAELNALQSVKRQKEKRFDADELVERYQRAKMDRELLAVLTKYVRIDSRGAHKKGS